MPRIKLGEYQNCTQINDRMHMHMVCLYHLTGLLCATSTVIVSVVHKNMSYYGVQVYIRNNASVCTNA